MLDSDAVLHGYMVRGGDEAPTRAALTVIGLSPNIPARDHKLCVTVRSCFAPFPPCVFNTAACQAALYISPRFLHRLEGCSRVTGRGEDVS